jgi:hypothetical protein
MKPRRNGLVCTCWLMHSTKEVCLGSHTPVASPVCPNLVVAERLRLTMNLPVCWSV